MFSSCITVFDPVWINFYTGWEVGIQFHSSACGTQFFQHHWLKRLSFSNVCFPLYKKSGYCSTWAYFCVFYFIPLFSMSVNLNSDKMIVSALLFLPRISMATQYFSIWTLGLIFLLLWTMTLGFWSGLQWICRLLSKTVNYFILLIFPTHRYERTFHYLMSSVSFCIIFTSFIAEVFHILSLVYS
jgi:hypothetical protein